jgi:hypothetical protein
LIGFNKAVDQARYRTTAKGLVVVAAADCAESVALDKDAASDPLVSHFGPAHDSFIRATQLR